MGRAEIYRCWMAIAMPIWYTLPPMLRSELIKFVRPGQTIRRPKRPRIRRVAIVQMFLRELGKNPHRGRAAAVTARSLGISLSTVRRVTRLVVGVAP